jgi:hypothetical protein
LLIFKHSPKGCGEEGLLDGEKVRRAYRGRPRGCVAVRVNHRRVITSCGAYDVGRVSHFAIVDGPPPIPSGVLCLVELDDNDIGRGVFDAVAGGELWAFSLGGNGKAEVSLTDRPAFTNCRIVGWARTRWPPGSCLPGWRSASRLTQLLSVQSGAVEALSCMYLESSPTWISTPAASGGCMINLTGSARA